MPNSNYPVIHVPLSRLIKIDSFDISPDLNDKLTKNSQELVNNSFVQLDHENKTHTPLIHAESLANSIGTDRKQIRELLAESPENTIVRNGTEVYITSPIAKQFLQERSEQPRSLSEQTMIKETQLIVNQAGRLTYEEIINQSEQKSE